MKIIDNLKKKILNWTLQNPEKWFSENFGNTSNTGVNVTKENALKVASVLACVRLISENVASLPLTLYRRTDKGKTKATDRIEYSMFHDVMNKNQDSFQGWIGLMLNVLLFGVGYAEIVRNGAGQVAALYPLVSGAVKKTYNKDKKEYEYTVSVGTEKIPMPKSKIFEIDWLSLDSLNVFEPLELAREAIGLNIASETYAGNYFKNGANVGGFVEYGDVMDDIAKDRFREQINKAYSGLANSNKLVFLEEGSKFQKVSNNPLESQMLETRKFQVIEIARFFNVPPHMIMDLEKATFSNIEQQSLNFVTYCLRTWLIRIEKAIMSQLFTAEDRKTLFVKFNVDALLRGEYTTRMEGYAIGRQNGWLSANDIRELEDMDKLDEGQGGDEYLVNGNMKTILEQKQEEKAKKEGASK